MEVPRLGVKSEVQLRPTVTETLNLSRILYTTAYVNAGSRNPPSEARDWTHILRDTMSGSEFAEPQWELPLAIFLILHLVVMNCLPILEYNQNHLP